MKNRATVFFFAMYKTGRILLGSGACRHYPTCSDYSKEAFEKYAFLKALSLTARRLASCHPFSNGGYDPLP
ncbi:MAG: membrane protein insertion efficiency factor YidD [Elusimicrobia bacterium CG08_land_8_20_14_0_20_51_18]|nr:MAG: membrane protein insertion efficiency factor YidD [Elusimicrobia bacterium CG08_land_8_20_14_0_20_51_18]